MPLPFELIFTFVNMSVHELRNAGKKTMPAFDNNILYNAKGLSYFAKLFTK